MSIPYYLASKILAYYFSYFSIAIFDIDPRGGRPERARGGPWMMRVRCMWMHAGDVDV